jgi:hypothetical protein
MSGLPPKADMCGATRDVRFVPIADIGSATRSEREWPPTEAAYTIALKPKRWRFGRRSGGERIAAFAMKYIQPFRCRLLDAVPIHYLLAFRAIGVGNYR